MKQETLIEVAKAAPPLSVGGLTMWGIPLAEWVLVFSLIYTALLIIDKLPVVIRRFRDLFNKLRSL